MRYVLALLALASGCARPAVATSSAVSSTDLTQSIVDGDAALGSRTGTIELTGGGIVNGPITLASGHSLHLGSGSYELHAPEATPVFVVGDGVSIYGDGILRTTVTEPESLIMVTGVNNVDNLLAAGNDDWHFRDMHIVPGAQVPLGIGFPSDIAVGNSTRVTVERVYFDGTMGNSVEIGGWSLYYGNHADDVQVLDSSFRGMTDAVAIVNGRNIVVDGCEFAGNVISSDIEPNASSDWATNITYSHNRGLIVLVQSEVTGPVNVVDNPAVEAVFVYNAHDVLISGNHFHRDDPCNGSIFLNGADRPVVEHNEIVNTGAVGGACAVMFLTGDIYANGTPHPTTQATIGWNRIYTTATGVGSAGIIERAFVDSRWPDSATTPPDYNTFVGNTLGPGRDANGNPEAGYIVTAGPHDIVTRNVLIGGAM